MWVRGFGDHRVSQEEPRRLKTLSEGLDAHFTERQNARRGRKLNTNLERAIQEAMDELERQTAQQTSPTAAAAAATHDVTDGGSGATAAAAEVKVTASKKKRR